MGYSSNSTGAQGYSSGSIFQRNKNSSHNQSYQHSFSNHQQSLPTLQPLPSRRQTLPDMSDQPGDGASASQGLQHELLMHQHALLSRQQQQQQQQHNIGYQLDSRASNSEDPQRSLLIHQQALLSRQQQQPLPNMGEAQPGGTPSQRKGRKPLFWSSDPEDDGDNASNTPSVEDKDSDFQHSGDSDEGIWEKAFTCPAKGCKFAHTTAAGIEKHFKVSCFGFCTAQNL
jgi:hypothetical protein